MSTSETECASLMLETFPLAMRTFAQEGREHVKGQYTVPQYRILFILHDQGSVSMGRMAEMHGVTLPTMTKIVSGLVERGLVEREAAPHDRRVVQLRLSEQGNELFDHIHRHLHDRIAALFAH